jgi:hypothetical protein
MTNNNNENYLVDSMTPNIDLKALNELFESDTKAPVDVPSEFVPCASEDINLDINIPRNIYNELLTPLDINFNN